MKIQRFSVYAKTYSLTKTFVISGGRTASEQDSTIVRIETDEGLVGWGEQCAFSPSYLVGHAPGARAALSMLAPALLGCDPRETAAVGERMNAVMMGHNYAKSPVDIACWDILGQSAGLPVSELLGGKFNPTFPVYAVVSLAEPGAMAEDCARLAADGYRRFQLKVGQDPTDDVARVRACVEAVPNAERVIVDANGNWLLHDAVRAVAELNDLDVYIEQPCATIAHCAEVRARSSRPFIVDENLYGVDDLVAARDAHAMDAVRFKLSRLGGISPTRLARDLSVEWGLALTIEDAGGADIASAAIAHLTASTPTRFVLDGYLVSESVTESIATGGPYVENGVGHVPTAPGLGLVVDEKMLGEPVLDFVA